MELLNVLNIDVEEGIVEELGGNDKRNKTLYEIAILIHKFGITLESLRSASISKPDSISALKFKYEEFIDNLAILMKKLDCEYIYKDIDITKDIKVKFKFNDKLSYILKIDRKYNISIYRKKKK